MYWRMIESRSDDDYSQSESDADEPFFKWPGFLLFCVCCVIALVVGISS